MEFLGHSANGEISPQSYKDHVEGVMRRACKSAEAATLHNPKLRDSLLSVVKYSSEYHDLGKIIESNQDVLHGLVKASRLPVCHFIHGSYLLRSKMKQVLSSFVSASHHVPFGNFGEPFDCFLEKYTDGKTIIDATSNLEDILKIHKELVNFNEEIVNENIDKIPPHQTMFLRMALSILVDADHGDTSSNYGNFYPSQTVELRPKERLAKLDEYVRSLPYSSRNKVRQKFYEQCVNSLRVIGLASCDGVVGIGKSIAILAHLLKISIEMDLRRIITVQPFTSIIDQTTDIYRKGIVLPGEDIKDVVTSHHHKVDYITKEYKSYATNWYSPFVTTTAVQFFETLINNYPTGLRKLHNVARSAIFIDEAHLFPMRLCPLALQLLNELQERWGCYIVLGSGTMNKFWEIKDLQNKFYPKVSVKNINNNSYVRRLANKQEKTRIKYYSEPKKFDKFDFLDWINTFPGPRLVILNTTQICAVLALIESSRHGRKCVEHLSTVLAPKDTQERIITIKKRLSIPEDNDWTLFATSCGGCGLNFDFRNGFQQRTSLSSLQQTGGRVNRENKYIDSVIWDFDLKIDKSINFHPDFQIPSMVLSDFMKNNENSVDLISSRDITDSIRREVLRRNELSKFSEEIMTSERKMRFKDVAENFKVISTDTKTCIIDHKIANLIRNNEDVDPKDIQDNSIQIWYNKLEKYSSIPITNEKENELYEWMLEYDSFLGCMAGILPKLDLGGDFSVY